MFNKQEVYFERTTTIGKIPSPFAPGETLALKYLKQPSYVSNNS